MTRRYKPATGFMQTFYYIFFFLVFLRRLLLLVDMLQVAGLFYPNGSNNHFHFQFSSATSNSQKTSLVPHHLRICSGVPLLFCPLANGPYTRKALKIFPSTSHIACIGLEGAFCFSFFTIEAPITELLNLFLIRVLSKRLSYLLNGVTILKYRECNVVNFKSRFK